MSFIFLHNIPEAIEIREVMKDGKFVAVDVVKATESPFGRPRYHYLDFQFQDRTRSIRISKAFYQQVKSKQKTELLHLIKYPDLFMPADYDDKGQFYSLIALVCFFVLLVPASAFRIYQLSRLYGQLPLCS